KCPGRTTGEMSGEAAALNSRQASTARVELANLHAIRKRTVRELRELRERDARLGHLHQTRCAARDEKERRHRRRQFADPLEEPLPGGERALIRNGVGALMRLHA